MLTSKTHTNPDQTRDVPVPDLAFLLVQHPDEIVTNLALSTSQKREILASWASDERTVVGTPALRQLPSGAIVRLYDIQQALRSLDRKERQPHRRIGWRDEARRRRGIARWIAGRAWRPWDDDDDPPPSPVASRRPVPFSIAV